METAEFIREMSKVELRLVPGMKLRMSEPGGLDAVMLTLTYDCEDSVKCDRREFQVVRDRPIHGHIIAKVPREEWRGLFITNLWVLMHDLWMHELEEWFTVDGKHYHEPHPELRHV